MPVARKKVQGGGADKATVIGFAPVVSMARSTGKLQE
jgi:hypothetical protein